MAEEERDEGEEDTEMSCTVRARMTVRDVEKTEELGLVFFASPAETPICIYDQLELSRIAKSSTAQWTFNLLKKVWYQNVMAANEIKGEGFFTLEMPAFLIKILRECTTPDDIWKVALQMRQVKEAKAFRQWVTRIDTIHDIEQILVERKEIEELARKLDYRIGGGSARPLLGKISIGMPWGYL